MKYWFTVILFCLLLCGATACDRRPQTDVEPSKLIVVTTLFPLYDFARIIGGTHVHVQLLLPPGTEPHSYEPKPSDIALLTKAHLFIYTNKYMEPWAAKLIAGVHNPSLTIVDASEGIRMHLADHDDADHNWHNHANGTDALHITRERIDPHIWLDFANAAQMVETIRNAFIAKDNVHAEFYRQNAAKLQAELKELDKKYAALLSHCATRELVSGGHFAFGYLTHRYGLHYYAAYGFSPSAEPAPRDLMKLSQLVKKHKITTIFYEELIEPRVAETIAKETGVSLLMLHGAHNISRSDFEAGVTFIELMERNYEALKKGLRCR